MGSPTVGRPGPSEARRPCVGRAGGRPQQHGARHGRLAALPQFAWTASAARPKIAPAVFARLFEPQQQVSHSSSYGLGFFLQTRSGVLLAEHGGNVPGYTAQVVHVPDRALSLALLTNQDSSPARSDCARAVLGHRREAGSCSATGHVEPTRHAAAEARRRRRGGARPIAPERLAGHYFSSQGGAFEVRSSDSGAICGLQRPAALSAEADRHQHSSILSGLSGFSVRFAESPRHAGTPHRVSAAAAVASRRQHRLSQDRTTPGLPAPRRSMTDPTRS